MDSQGLLDALLWLKGWGYKEGPGQVRTKPLPPPRVPF
jgi:hypothetical protein